MFLFFLRSPGLRLHPHSTRGLRDPTADVVHPVTRQGPRLALSHFNYVTQQQWKDAAAYPIQVYFADEPIQSLKSVPQPCVGAL